MAIIFPKGMFCTADESTILLKGSIRLNVDNKAMPSANEYTVYLPTNWGELNNLPSIFNTAAELGLPVTTRALMFYSSVDRDPSSDYFQQTPRQICDIDRDHFPAAFDVIALMRDHGNNYRFYPTYEDKSFYIEMVFSSIDYGARILLRYMRGNNELYYTYKSVTGTSNYFGGPYRGTAQITSIIGWEGYDSSGNHNLVYSWAQGVAKYKFVGPGAGTWDDVSSAGSVYVGYSQTSLGTWWDTWIGGFEPLVPDDDNPYWNGGTSDVGGGDGNFSDESDNPETDVLPVIDAVGTGMATIFKPDRSQLRALSELFWNSNVFTFLQNLVENITNMFISLAMVPFNVQAGSTVSVTWLGIDTAVSLTLAAKQFYEFNMGTIDLANDSRIFTSGSALDYAPFSSLGIYLPFIGYRDLDIDECRGAGVNLRYRIDILSGSCVAIIKVGGRDIYEFTGNCLTQIPITNENMQSLVSDAVNIGLAVANAESAGAVASGVEADAIAAGEPLTAEKSAHMDQMVSRSRGQLASATANAAMGMKPNFAKTGAVSGSVAMMSVKQPYLFLKTPRQSLPEHYQRYCGFPSNISGKLSDFSGFTVVEDIRLNGLVATSPEVAEIYKLLKSGVII